MNRFTVGALSVMLSLAVAGVAHAAQTGTATDLGGGTVDFAITLPSGEAFVQLFVRRNGIQNVSLEITRHATDLGDGTTRYAFTIPNYYRGGDRIEYRFYSYLPASPGVFSPGPIENEWRLMDYGDNRFVGNDAAYTIGAQTDSNGAAIDIEVYDIDQLSEIAPVSVGWELDRANPSPFVAPLLGRSATMLGVYVAACDGSGWVRIDGTPFAVAAPSERSDGSSGRYSWSGTFDAALPGQTVDPTYECGGYDTIVDTLIGEQTLRTNASVRLAYVVQYTH